MRGASRDHVADQPNRVEDPRTAVDEVADEHRGPAIGVCVDRTAVGEVAVPLLCELVAELGKQELELVAAAVDVPDDVEWAVLVGAVIPQARAPDRRRLDRLRRIENVHLAKPLFAHTAQPTPQVANLIADYMRPEVAVGPIPIPDLAQPLREVKHDRDREEVVFTRQLDELRAVLALDVRRVDDRHAPASHALASDEVQDLESIARSTLVVLVVSHERAAEIRGQDLRRTESLGRERRLTRTRRADQDDERKLRHLKLARCHLARLSGHRSNTAICVGAPSAGSSGPTGRNRTR